MHLLISRKVIKSFTAIPGILLHVGTLHLVKGTQAPEKELLYRMRPKILELGVRVEARPPRNREICIVNLYEATGL